MRPAAICLAVAAALCLGAASSPARPPLAHTAARAVSVNDDFFSPKTVTIGKGGRVTWRWKGSGDHNVTFRKHAGRPSRCGTRSSGSCTRRFRSAGTYRYLCTIHGFTGRVKVE
jgi:plastocyanin